MVFAHAVLLFHQHVDERLPVFVFLKFFEQRLLRFGHRAGDAMTLTFEFADVDAGAGLLGHRKPG